MATVLVTMLAMATMVTMAADWQWRGIFGLNGGVGDQMAYKNWGHFVASGDIVRWSMTVYDRVSHSLFKWAYNIL